MAVATSNLQIEIEGETYALDKVPDGNSAVVLAERDNLLGVIDLKALVTDLGRVGGFIRVAYNGVGAAGHRYAKDQIQIQRLGYDITKLCDKSALTVTKFKRASSSILGDLQSTYEYLIINKEEMAVHTLSTVSNIAGKMQKAAFDLQQEFEKEVTNVTTALESTQEHAATRKDEKISEQQKLKAELENKERLIREHQEREREAVRRRKRLEQEEEWAISEIGNVGPFEGIVNHIFGTQIFRNKDAEKRAVALRKARYEALEAEQAIRNHRSEALAKMESFTKEIKKCAKEKDHLADIAIKALQQAAGALKHLSAVMMQVATFWGHMQQHCLSLAESEMKSHIEEALKYSKEERIQVWTSKSFKRQAVEFYAGWVALNGVCTTYMEQIKLTQKDLYKFISENPTCEESLKNLEELADCFLGDLECDRKALSDKEFKAQKEIEALKTLED